MYIWQGYYIQSNTVTTSVVYFFQAGVLFQRDQKTGCFKQRIIQKLCTKLSDSVIDFKIAIFKGHAFDFKLNSWIFRRREIPIKVKGKEGKDQHTHLFSSHHLQLKKMSSKVNMVNQRSCDLCPKTFVSRTGLSYHKMTHKSGEKKFNCAQCNKSFNHAVLLKRHLLTHAGEKQQKCRQCNYSTNHNSALRQHVMKHTGEKPHHCNECSYTSIQANHMKRHKRTHSGEKPHRCTICEYSSITPGNLNKHIMGMHSGEKPFKCDQCNYDCTQAHKLRQHMMTHTGERPFKYNQCSKAFKQKIQLTRHFQVHMTSKQSTCF